MSFTTDKQTQEDLNISGRFRLNAISRLFDRTVTSGGGRLMEKLFQQPLSDDIEINKRTAVFSYFREFEKQFPFSHDEYEAVANYLHTGVSGNLFSTGVLILWQKVMAVAAQDTSYHRLTVEVIQTINLLQRLWDFVSGMSNEHHPYQEETAKINALLNDPRLKWVKEVTPFQTLSLSMLVRYDYTFRVVMIREMKSILDMISWLDVYLSVAQVARERGFSFAIALPSDKQILHIRQLYHPSLENAVGNTICLDQRKNVLFLTGANMAGKSTLMKSIGISIYLAHMGFPVAATFMEFSVKNGLYTSINVPDNLSLGHSHFYAEVLRVKAVAEAVSRGENLVAIFDELFKGTNVKDAYDATLAISEAFSENGNCLFVISTHIIEVGEALMGCCTNFEFAFMPTVMQGSVPTYPYQLTEGITADRQGMIIIENEGILDILNPGIITSDG